MKDPVRFIDLMALAAGAGCTDFVKAAACAIVEIRRRPDRPWQETMADAFAHLRFTFPRLFVGHAVDFTWTK